MESAPAKSTLRVEQGVPGPDGRAGLTLVYMDIEGAEGRPSEFDVVRLPADNTVRLPPRNPTDVVADARQHPAGHAHAVPHLAQD